MRTGCLVLLVLSACAGSPGTGSTTGGGPTPLTLGQACHPLAVRDACTLDGYVCVQQLDGGNFCNYADLGDRCLPSVGCTPDSQLLCDLFPSPDDGGTPPATFCTLPCTTPDDCLDPGQDCYPDATDGGGCQYNFCAAANAGCLVGSDPNGGTCLPIDALGDLICLQNGTVPLGSPCSRTRIDGGSYLCGLDDGCLDGLQGESACVPLCDPDGGCPSGDVCEQTLSICALPCTSTAGCPGAFTCQQDFDTEGNPLDGGDLCLLP